MSRRRKGQPVHGWIVLDKPVGRTSAWAVGAVRRLLEAELEQGDGPTVLAVAERRTVEVDLATLCRRWPALAGAAASAGIGGMLAIPLHTDQLSLGCFTVLAGSHALDDHARSIAATLARAALLAVERHHHEHHTQRALESRSLIGSAIGILMERYDLAAPAAWEHLRRRASQEERKLRDVQALPAADAVRLIGDEPA